MASRKNIKWESVLSVLSNAMFWRMHSHGSCCCSEAFASTLTARLILTGVVLMLNVVKMEMVLIMTLPTFSIVCWGIRLPDKVHALSKWVKFFMVHATPVAPAACILKQPSTVRQQWGIYSCEPVNIKVVHYMKASEAWIHDCAIGQSVRTVHNSQDRQQMLCKKNMHPWESWEIIKTHFLWKGIYYAYEYIQRTQCLAFDGFSSQ